MDRPMSGGTGIPTVTRQRSAKGRRDPVRARLRAMYPPELRTILELGSERLVVGRAPDAAAGLDHGTVSRQHLVVEWDPSVPAYVVSDLGSHNGTWIDGAPAGEGRHALAENSLVRLGDVLLVFESYTGRLPVVRSLADELLGQSPAMAQLRETVDRAAADRAPALIIGETGTGKERIAKQLHHLSGRKGAWIALNCATLSPQIVESELFGHVRGAFTGATDAQQGLFRAAEGGTLFLDEIGELPLDLQPKLLRVIQEREVYPVGSAKAVKIDVRLVAATNRDLVARVDAGEFRRDLYARLAMWGLTVPPLRERRGDILEWVAHLHRCWCRERNTVGALGFEPDAAEAIVIGEWPENLRGIERLVHELASARWQGEVRLDQLPKWLPTRPERAPAAAPAARLPAPATREELEGVLARVGGSVRAAAKHYGRDRRQLRRWMDAFGLRATQEDDEG